jgi:hypothetical protein
MRNIFAARLAPLLIILLPTSRVIWGILFLLSELLTFRVLHIFLYVKEKQYSSRISISQRRVRLVLYNTYQPSSKEIVHGSKYCIKQLRILITNLIYNY